MKKIIKIYIVCFIMLSLSCMALQLKNFWHTPDSQAMQLLQQGKAKEAEKMFKNHDWKNVAMYRAQNYAEAYQSFVAKNTSEDQYNAGNAAAFAGQYALAIKAYDKSLALNPKNTDAKYNRDIVKKLLDQKNKSQDQDKSEKDKKNSKEQKNDKDKNDKDKNDKVKNDKDKNDKDKNDKDKNDKDKNDKDKNDKDKNDKDKNDKDKNDKDKNDKDKNDKDKNPGDKPNSSDTPKNSEADVKPNDKTNTNQNLQQNKPETADPSSEAFRSAQQSKEDKNQLLRRLDDDPGGLLQQKFIRDYMCRHEADQQVDGD